jgi:hypothetical protein
VAPESPPRIAASPRERRMQLRAVQGSWSLIAVAGSVDCLLISSIGIAKSCTNTEFFCRSGASRLVKAICPRRNGLRARLPFHHFSPPNVPLPCRDSCVLLPWPPRRVSVGLVRWEHMSSSTPPESKQKPQWHLRAGGLEVACWKSVVKSEDESNRDFFSVTAHRAYKDKAGKWQHTQSLRRQDLLPMARLIEQAYDKLSATAKDVH